MSGRIVHFEIPADNPEKTIKFYEEVFGWKFQRWDGPETYWLITTGENNQPGINGGLMKKGTFQYIVNTMDVDNIDETIKKIEAAGGEIYAPKMAVPGVGWMIYFKDVEGNLFGAMQADPTAR